MRLVLLMTADMLAGASSVCARPVIVERVEVDEAPMPTVRLHFSAAPTAPCAGTLPSSARRPARIFIDFAASTLGAEARAARLGSGPLVRVRTGQFQPSTARIVLDLTALVPFEMQTEGRVVTIVVGEADESSAVTQVAPAPAAAPKPPVEPVASARGPPACATAAGDEPKPSRTICAPACNSRRPEP